MLTNTAMVWIATENVVEQQLQEEQKKKNQTQQGSTSSYMLLNTQGLSQNRSTLYYNQRKTILPTQITSAKNRQRK